MKITEMNDGTFVYGDFLVNDVKRCLDNKGQPYLAVVLQDNSGTIESRKWSVVEGDEDIIVKGTVIYVEGRVNRYNTSLQMKILSCEKVKEENIDWHNFIASAPVELQEMEDKLKAYIESIQNEDVKALVERMISNYGKKFYLWPAAVRNHHDFISGLLYHSLTMADMAVKVCQVYPAINRDVLLGGAIIHDMGKIVELSGPQGTTFTLEGKMLGHIAIGQAELRKAAKELGMYAYDDLPEEEKKESHPLYRKKEIAVLMEHMILSHHGQPDFGSAIRPLTREAFVLSMIDDLDAKMTILDKAYAGVELGASTAKLFNMDERYFYKPLYTENPAKPSGTSLEEEKRDLDK